MGIDYDLTEREIEDFAAELQELEGWDLQEQAEILSAENQ